MEAYPSQFREAAEPIIIQAVEHGFMHHYMRSCEAALTYGVNFKADDNNDTTDNAGSAFDDLFLVFCGWLVCLTIALIVFGLELVCYHYKIIKFCICNLSFN